MDAFSKQWKTAASKWPNSRFLWSKVMLSMQMDIVVIACLEHYYTKCCGSPVLIEIWYYRQSQQCNLAIAIILCSRADILKERQKKAKTHNFTFYIYYCDQLIQLCWYVQIPLTTPGASNIMLFFFRSYVLHPSIGLVWGSSNDLYLNLQIVLQMRP